MPRVIVCEGSADEAVLRALIRHRSLPEFHIRTPEDCMGGRGGGIDQLPATVAGFVSATGFEQVRHILIIVDSDRAPADNFERLRTRLAAMPDLPFAVPDRPGERSAGDPTVCVVLLPWHDLPGTLETLCRTAAEAVSPAITKCVDAFGTCVGTAAWNNDILTAKFRLRAILAGAHQRNPSIGIGRLHLEAPELMPLDHPCFDRLSALLEGYR